MAKSKLVQWDDALLEIDIKQSERIRKFACGECQREFGTIQRKADNTEYTKCPHCGAEALDSIIMGAPMGFVRGEAKTLGQLAERNTKKMGRYEKEAKDRKFAESDKEARKTIKAPNQEKAEKIKKLNKLDKEGVRKYIETGKGI